MDKFNQVLAQAQGELEEAEAAFEAAMAACQEDPETAAAAKLAWANVVWFRESVETVLKYRPKAA